MCAFSCFAGIISFISLIEVTHLWKRPEIMELSLQDIINMWHEVNLIKKSWENIYVAYFAVGRWGMGDNSD